MLAEKMRLIAVYRVRNVSVWYTGSCHLNAWCEIV
jgi:hypothetical protein